MLADTSGLICYFNQASAEHAKAVEVFRSATVLLTHSYIIAEFVASIDRTNVPRTLILSFISDLESNETAEIVYVDRQLHERALDLLRSRLDKNWSLCDAVSFSLMNDRRMNEAMTLDRHFEQAGFQRLLA